MARRFKNLRGVSNLMHNHPPMAGAVLEVENEEDEKQEDEIDK